MDVETVAAARGWHSTRPVEENAGTSLPRRIVAESWRTFASGETGDVPCLVEGLWPVGALGFVAGPPKGGKTWLGLTLALSLVTGLPFLGRFAVPRPVPVLYVALEGHKAAIRARVGALARGFGLDPAQEIPRLCIAYKPRGLNLADQGWADELAEVAGELGAALVVVDVLRRAAIFDENSAAEFAALLGNLEAVMEDRSIGLLHHFTKTNESSKIRTPAERMSGSGAMFGALDIGIFITGRDGRSYSLAVESRDLAEPEPLIVRLDGEGSGPNGGFTFRDSCALVSESDTRTGVPVKAPADEIAAFVQESGSRTPKEIKARFNISDKTLKVRREDMKALGIAYVPAGTGSRYECAKTCEATRNSESPEHLPVPEVGDANPHGYTQAAPTPEHPVPNPLRGTKNPSFQGNPNQEHPDPYGDEPLESGAARPGPDDAEIERLLAKHSDIAGPSG